MKFLAAVLSLAALLALAFVLYGRERSWVLLTGPADLGPYDFDGGRRSASGNDALACTPGSCAAPDIVVAADFASPETAIDALEIRLRAIEPQTARVDDGGDPAYRRFVVHSPWMRFPDTVDIGAMRLDDGRTGVRAYSRSKLGRGDLGVNRKRLEALFLPE